MTWLPNGSTSSIARRRRTIPIPTIRPRSGAVPSSTTAPLTYGRVSFAILADRQFKSGPEGKVPPSGSKRGDHVMDPNFDPKIADVRGVELLGAKQEQFLREWAADWRGADMKAVISQTIFTALPTTHGNERMILRADYDTNAWPQTPRNRAVREMRKASAFHIAGDQHIPAVVQYGVEGHRDGPVAFAGPAMNVGYPRWWEPSAAKWTQPKNDNDLTGDFTDSFGHPLTVLAVKNGAIQPRQGNVKQLSGGQSLRARGRPLRQEESPHYDRMLAVPRRRDEGRHPDARMAGDDRCAQDVREQGLTV